MKWYFAVSQASLARDDHDWAGLLRTAVNSAARNTTLTPILLYDGAPSALTEDLASRGVAIIPHRVSFYDRLAAHAERAGHNPMWLAVASAAFQRFDIPLIEQQDDLVLYTDADVVFLNEPDFYRSAPPALFAASTQSTENYADMNSGVMLINVPAMRQDHANLCAFAAGHLALGLDQEVLRVFYQDRYDLLDRSLNWKPYWGYNPRAQILHFHGPKPATVRRFLRDDRHATYAEWTVLLNHDRVGYQVYLDIWDRYADPDRVICMVDVISNTCVAGWAVYQRAASRRVEFKVTLDGADDGSIVCDQPRPDVALAGFGGPRCGFRYRPPDAPPGAKPRRLDLADVDGLAVELLIQGNPAICCMVPPPST